MIGQSVQLFRWAAFFGVAVVARQHLGPINRDTPRLQYAGTECDRRHLLS